MPNTCGASQRLSVPNSTLVHGPKNQPTAPHDQHMHMELAIKHSLRSLSQYFGEMNQQRALLSRPEIRTPYLPPLHWPGLSCSLINSRRFLNPHARRQRCPELSLFICQAPGSPSERGSDQYLLGEGFPRITCRRRDALPSEALRESPSTDHLALSLTA